MMWGRVKGKILNFIGVACAHLPDRWKHFLKPLAAGYCRFSKKLASSIKEEGTMRTPFGFLMYVNYADRVERGIALGMYETGYAKKFSAAVKEGAVVIDAGAYCGYFAMIASEKTGPKGVVYAFEPVGQNHERLLKNIDLNRMKNVVSLCEGLSDRVEQRAMYIPEGLASQSSISGKSWAELSRHEPWEKKIVQAHFITLDSFVRERQLMHVDIVKIDAEGAEVKILRGMRNTLLRYDPVLFMEIVPPVMEQVGDSVDELLEILLECHFKKIFSVAKNESLDIAPSSLPQAKDFILSGGYTFIIRKN